MPLANTPRSYGSLAKTFHWLMAALIFAQIPLGLYANRLAADLRDPATPATLADIERTALLFSLHKTLGLTLLLLALARIGWALIQPRPGLLNAHLRAEAFLAETVHRVIYGALVLVPLSGWISHAAATGFAPIWWPFGQSLPFVPKSEALAAWAGSLHVVLQRIFFVALALHVAGALKHALIDRDATLRRMLPGPAATPVPPPQRRTIRPVLAALAAWAAGLAIAVNTGSLAPPPNLSAQNAQPGPELSPAPDAPPADNWQVTGGQIALTVTRAGNTVSGAFTDWSAAIVWNAPPSPGPAGYVDVVIESGSPTLAGSGDALSPRDLFGASTWPTTIFTAEIGRGDSGDVAIGTLSVGERTEPVSAPVEIAVQGDGTLSFRTRLDLAPFAPAPAAAPPAPTMALTITLTARQGG